MRRIDYTVPPAYDGRKVIHFLRGGAGCSYTLVRSLKTQEDGILLNGARVRTIDRIHAGDRLSVTLRDHPKDAQQSGLAVPVLYEDDDLVVFAKPAGMACHPAKQLQQDTLANVFAALCGGALTCRILNRMDKDTSGAVLIAKNAFAAASLTGKVRKVYLAAVSGAPEPPKGAVDAPVGQPDRCDPRRAVLPEGKPARTEYETLALRGEYSIVRCTLPTGRTHQIRVHMRQIGCPLLGDALYGGPCGRIERQALHCARISFVHPVTGGEIAVEAPLPQDMQNLFPDAPQSW